MIKRRSALGLAAASVAVIAFPWKTATATEASAFETFRDLSDFDRGRLVGDYRMHFDEEIGIGMWAGRFSQNFASVIPAALALGASDFGSLKAAFSQRFLVTGGKDERLPMPLRRRLSAAASVIPGFDPHPGVEQGPVFEAHHSFIAMHMVRLLDHLSADYPGAGADIRAGRYDWSRAAIRL
jgi:hypothetical protein